LGRERVENPRDQVQVGSEIEAEVIQIDMRERRIALSVRSLLDSQDKAEIRQYMSKSGDSSRTTLGDLLHKELEKGRGAAREAADQEGSEK
jgi:small subunit ribosomal protein S1